MPSVDGLKAYKRGLSGEEKKRFNETWDKVFGNKKYEEVKAEKTKDASCW